MRNICLIILTCFIFNACATWDGIKKDSNKIWTKTKETSKKVYKDTKKKIHKATADNEEKKTKEDK